MSLKGLCEGADLFTWEYVGSVRKAGEYTHALCSLDGGVYHGAAGSDCLSGLCARTEHVRKGWWPAGARLVPSGVGGCRRARGRGARLICVVVARARHREKDSV